MPFVYLTSEDATESNNIFKYELLNKALFCPKFTIKKITLPFSWYVYTVSNSLLNSGGFTTVGFEGNYNITDLLTKIVTALDAADAASAPFGATYDKNTNKVTITSTVASVLDFSIAGSIGDRIGFGSTVTASDTTHVGPDVVQINGSPSVYMKSSKLAVAYTRNIFKGEESDVIQNIPVDKKFNEIIVQDISSPELVACERDFKFLDFWFVNEKNETLDLNGGRFTIELYVHD